MVDIKENDNNERGEQENAPHMIGGAMVGLVEINMGSLSSAPVPSI